MSDTDLRFPPPPDELLETPPEGCERIHFSTVKNSLPSYVSGEPEGDRIRTRYYWRKREGVMVVRAWFGPGTKGPPGHAHGGSITALLDEVMGASAWRSGHKVLAARLTIHFRRPLPLGSQVLVEGWIERVSGRKVITMAHMKDLEGRVVADSEGLFLELAEDLLEKLGEIEEAG